METIAHNIHMARFANSMGEHSQALEICAAALAQVNALAPGEHKARLAAKLFCIMNKLRGRVRRTRKGV